ncbi:malonate decarboxylase subunit alpha, partial [Paraburkholderia sp. BR14427]
RYQVGGARREAQDGFPHALDVGLPALRAARARGLDENTARIDDLPRVDIPGSWVDVVVQADRPFAVEPLFTRDPRHIGDLQVL